MKGIELREAVFEDAAMVFQWRNIPEIIALGSTRRSVTWEEHSQWFEQTVLNKERLLLIILRENKAIGQARFDLHGDNGEVSIYLLPGNTGRGLGVLALTQACWEAFAKMPLKRIVAFVRQNNKRSLSAFKKAGFKHATAVPLDLPPEHAALELAPSPNVPHNRLTHGAEETEAIRETVESGHWAGGKKVEELERTLAQMARVKHAVCVSSGLSALRLALKGLGVRQGDNVLLPAYSCVALANATLSCGGTPFPVDVTTGDWNISATEGAKILNKARPRAAIAVNTFGAPAAIEKMLKWDIPIIEDCAHAFGALVDGKPLGGRSHASILSFYATKLIAGGEGGAVLTNSDELAEFIRSWRDYTDKAPHGERQNDKMTDLEAALVLCQLQRLENMILKRATIAERYRELLSSEAERMGVFRLPDASGERIWYRYTVELLQGSAQEVIDQMETYGIGAARPAEKWNPNPNSHHPVADKAYQRIVSLPAYPTLAPTEQERAANAFIKACERTFHD